MSAFDVFAADRAHVWHPYAPASASPGWQVVGAQGACLRVRQENGAERDVVDAMASWWCAVHGYRHPELDAAAKAQIDEFAHVMFGGLTHEPGVRVATQLAELAPAGLNRVFLADSGSVSVEVAMKAAVQVAQARGRSGNRFMALRGAYHGDTTGAMSVCDPDSGLHHLFAGALPRQVFAPAPPRAAEPHGIVDVHTDVDGVDAWMQATADLARAHASELAGIIVEPILQGVGGMRPYPAACLRFLRELADELGIVLIADEIATGFGRTGELFGCDHAGVVPDMMCVGKAMTGGYASGAAMIATADVADAVERSDAGVLMHGPTFMANPLVAAISSASLAIIARGAWREQVARVNERLRDGLAPAWDVPGVLAVRTMGAVGVIECDEPVNIPAVTNAAMERGVWVRPFRRLVYTMPPYVTADGQLDVLTAGLVEAVRSAGPAAVSAP